MIFCYIKSKLQNPFSILEGDLKKLYGIRTCSVLVYISLLIHYFTLIFVTANQGILDIPGKNTSFSST